MLKLRPGAISPVEYQTRYPKTVSLADGLRRSIEVDGREGLEQLHIVVRNSFEELSRIFSKEGFTRVKFEHKQPGQIGHGFNLKLKKPWEMHVRLVDLKEGLVGIHAEVEVSRDYIQHLFSQRTPVVYEIQEMLNKYHIECRMWNDNIKRYVRSVYDDYRVRLSTPSIPVLAWKPMLFVIGTIGSFYLWKYIHTL